MQKREFIVQDLLSKIYQNQFSEGKLPHQRALAEVYQVSRFTIQEAIKSLQDIGVITVVQGSGMYISKGAKQNPLVYNSLTRNPYDRISSKLLSLTKERANEKDCQTFQIEKGEEVWQFQRLRIVNFQLTQIETSRMPVSLFPELTQKVVESSIQKFVQQSGFKISHYITSYTPVLITKEQAIFLQCKKGSPAMKIDNRCLLDDGRVYEYSELIAIDYSCTYITPFNKQNHQFRQ
ncbi:GntR family transcriptional regulator [Vagococcus sp. BWB3-3]|uniref:GntR family transcriptional regulator n=1 Tax=Vagococcus allomyrinae TaxID=2794353 RepID=A0A940SVS2_9ENTE|nr:GntR family transcriptional regulator [Vagococcus allomyrinae]MBP1042179.1 GntR family transcriptional regulator [Vagococcus allomyrinae]